MAVIKIEKSLLAAMVAFALFLAALGCEDANLASLAAKYGADFDFPGETPETDGDAVDTEPDVTPADGDKEVDDIETVEIDSSTDGDESEGEGESDCSCFVGNECCDGCHPINELGGCLDDGLSCTNDYCVSGLCIHELPGGFCVIEGECLDEGAENSENVCEECRPAFNPFEWSPADAGKFCDDNDNTTSDDTCRDGVCAGVPPGCDCGGVDYCCDGCYFINEGGPCEHDLLHCTEDICRLGFCAHELDDASCLIDGACFNQGITDPENQCRECKPGLSVETWSDKTDGVACDNGDPCTPGDYCAEGACTSGQALVCSDPDQCHEAGACNPDTGLCEYPVKADGTACDDGNDDTGNDQCRDGVCLGEGCVCNVVSECCDGCNFTNQGGPCDSDGLHCTEDLCLVGVCWHVPETGWCAIGGECFDAGAENPANTCMFCSPVEDPNAWRAKPDGAICDDGDMCTGSDYCSGGRCAPEGLISCPPPDQCRSFGECDPETGDCNYLPVPDGLPCDDGNPDTANDACRGGVCLGEDCECPEANECCDGCNFINSGGACSEDGLVCTRDTCNEGVCEHKLRSGWCFIGEQCFINGAGNPLNICETCDAAVEQSAWSMSEDGVLCDDGDLCSIGDSCLDGRCLGGDPLDCSAPPGVCLFSGECDPEFGVCDFAEKPDGTACTDPDAGVDEGECLNGLCVSVGCECNEENECCDGCHPINDGQSCESDELGCTSDVCDGGTCTHNLEGGWCLIAGVCHGEGAVNPQNSCKTCDTGTNDASWTSMIDGSLCDDGNACSLVDSCLDGVCQGGAALECPPIDDCHEEGICDPENGECADGPELDDGETCSDGLYCNGEDFCSGGACSGHEFINWVPDDCDDGEICTYDFCQEGESGALCFNDQITGIDCDDGIFCNGVDTCNGGFCEHQWSDSLPDACIDGEVCTDDSCMEDAEGYACVNDPLTGTACDDGNLCTVDDNCEEGECIPGNPHVCESENSCVEGECNSETGECDWEDVPDTTPCDDNNLCTEGEVCLSGECTGEMLVCDDQAVCLELPGECNEATGECEYAFMAEGAQCDDGDETTGGDHCDGLGHCIGENCNCDNSNDECCSFCLAINEGGACEDGDGLECTAGSCAVGYCTTALMPGWCMIGDACVAENTVNQNNSCEACLPETNLFAWSKRPSGADCDDGVFCNGDDTCNGSGLCGHQWTDNMPPDCHDTNACTNDGCMEGGGQYSCTHQNLNGTDCDDLMACNGADTCEGGYCTGHEWSDNMPPDCNDGNECTADTCYEDSAGDLGFACDHDADALNGEACEDEGLSCTEDACQSGVCEHGRINGKCLIDGACYNDGQSNIQNECEYCDPYNSPTAWRNKPEGTNCAGDGITCTVDRCIAGGCDHDMIFDGYCLIEEECRTNHYENGDNECEWCDALSDRNDWSPKPDNTACADDGNVCREDVCIGGACDHPPEDSGTSCDDGEFCNGADACDGQGLCEHAGDPCDGGDPCNNICNEEEENCYLPQSSDCDDGEFCNGADACDGQGLCEHAGDPCEGGDDCNNTCNEEAENCYSPTTTGCNDNNECTDEDSCDGEGECHGIAKDCSDQIECTDDLCDIQTGECYNPVSSGKCLIGGACYDNGHVNENNVCLYCDESNPGAWSNKDSSTPCDDGNFCIIGDHCLEGECSGDQNPCHEEPDDLACTADSCNEDTDECEHDVTAGCAIDGACWGDEEDNPQNPCEYCNPQLSETQWTDRPSGHLCEDGEWCTVDDECDGEGACEGAMRNCHEDPDLTCTEDSCNEVDNECGHVVTVGCLIEGACWGDDENNPQNRCEYCNHITSATEWTPRPAGHGCDDGMACTGADECDGEGLCTHQYPDGMPDDCKDLNECTEESCKELQGGNYSCKRNWNSLNGEPCDDGNPCTDPDSCKHGLCLSEDVNCPATDPCTRGYCDPGTGDCEFENVPEGTFCETDQDLCTWEHCARSGSGDIMDCVVYRNLSDEGCDDDNECTYDRCNPDTGLCENIANEMNGEDCDCDENKCTQDACQNGICILALHGVVICDGPDEQPRNFPFDNSDWTNLYDNDCLDKYCDPETGDCVEPSHTQPDDDKPVVCGDNSGSYYMQYCQDVPGGGLDGCCTVYLYYGTCCLPEQEIYRTDACCILDQSIWRLIKNPNGICEDDGLDCTDDYCDERGFCLHEIHDGMCVIDNVCYEEGEANPANTCQYCNPKEGDYKSKVTWTYKTVYSLCSNPCSECSGGYCYYDGQTDPGEETPMRCMMNFSPEVACTYYSGEGEIIECMEAGCSPDGSECMLYPAPDYTPCNDGVYNTWNDICLSGVCSHADLGSPGDDTGNALGLPDGYPDVVFSNGELFVWHQDGSSGEGGFHPNAYQAGFSGEGADVTLGDLDRDGYIDLVYSAATGLSELYFGPLSDYGGTPTYLETHEARYNCIGDINGDGYLDIVFADIAGDSLIYWNDGENPNNGGPGAFTNSTVLPAPGHNAYGCAILDMNGDSRMDVIIAKHRKDSTEDDLLTEAIIFYGGRSSITDDYSFPQTASLWVHGAVDIAAVQFDPTDPEAPNLVRDVGFPDLVVSYGELFYSHVIWDPVLGRQLQSGFARKKLKLPHVWDENNLPSSGAYGNTVIDIDGDGFLDIVFSSVLQGPQNLSPVYLGEVSYGGFKLVEGPALMTDMARGNAAGDLEGDGSADIIFSQEPGNSPYYWGPGYELGDVFATSPDPLLEVEAAGDYSHLKGNPDQDRSCVCHEVSLCCDGCNAYNQGRACTDDGEWICDAGLCRPLIIPWHMQGMVPQP